MGTSRRRKRLHLDRNSGRWFVWAKPAYRQNNQICPKNGNFKHEYISSICMGHDNNLYIGTSRGIVCYSPSNNSFERWTGNKQGTQAFSHLTINDIYEDSRGLLWIATAEGLNIYDRRTDEIIMPVSYNDMKTKLYRPSSKTVIRICG